MSNDSPKPGGDDVRPKAKDAPPAASQDMTPKDAAKAGLARPDENPFPPNRPKAPISETGEPERKGAPWYYVKTTNGMAYDPIPQADFSTLPEEEQRKDGRYPVEVMAKLKRHFNKPTPKGAHKPEIGFQREWILRTTLAHHKKTLQLNKLVTEAEYDAAVLEALHGVSCR